MYSKEEAHSQIAALVERFTEQLPSYKKSDYNETLTRRDFIDPFFKALGWDMNNSAGNAEAYREVIHEDKIKIGSATKAPDYSFRLPGGKRLFFVEAKKPSVYVKDEILPAYQVRRYAWSAKLPISILTDFEEFAVYDCKKKPNITDKASASRIKYITYKDYLPQFDFIWDNFSKEKVLKGGFDKFVQSDSNKKGTSTVDKEFLVSLDEWRKQLAQNIALRNIHLNEDEINYTVQQTIDRLIFLRIAEDRGVEEYGRLKRSLVSLTPGPSSQVERGKSLTPGPSPGGEGGSYYQNLFQYFKEADSKYNSGLFNFKKDTLSAGLALDNKVIKNILNELYYPISPYEFSVLSVEILGSAYEQFLGKQIRLTAGHKAVIEEKPEVRKAGGVYYTPQYIVEYIVKNTVGKLAEGKTPQEIEKIKIVDPACGSGSFLIGAYEYLLNYHQQYYKPKFEELTQIAASNEYTSRQRTDAQKERNKLPLTPDGNLTTAVKKQILLNNIFGVDIDTQAVEVTKLSLMLKCMEGETKSSINAEMNFGERVLPTLDDNIKCGNSLIDVDFYDGSLSFGDGWGEAGKVKPFSWEKAFPKVFKQGGFGCVIGNPPYVRVDTLEIYSKNYILKTYTSAKGKYDLYYLFVEKSTKILKEGGLLGYIIPNRFTTSDSGFNLREFLINSSKTININSVSKIKVFKQASVYPCILMIEKGKKIREINISETSIAENIDCPENSYSIDNSQINELPNLIFPINSKKKILDLYFTTLKTSDLIESILTIQEGLRIPKEIEDETGYYHILKQYQFSRYSSIKEGTYISENNLKKHISTNTERFKNCLKDKLVIAEDALRIEAVLDESKSICQGGVYFATLKPTFENLNLKFLLALINSDLLNAFYNSLYSGMHMGGGYMRYRTGFLNKLPIKIPKDEIEIKLSDEIVHLVETMLQLQKEKQQTTLPHKLDQLNTRIEYTDEKINKLVFELYGLGEEERRIVEGV